MKKRKSKRFSKYKLIKGLRGSISILLCLLVTPFLSITLGLIEYYRYQELFALSKEVMNVSAVSSMAEYDEYIHDRFGLMCSNQDIDTDDEALFKDNLSMLGKQMDSFELSIKGDDDLSLFNQTVLRKQLVDFGELTTTSAILLEDFNLQELLDSLQGVSQFEKIMGVVDDLASLSDAVTKAVEALDDLKTTIESLQTQITTTITSTQEYAKKCADFFKLIKDEGISLPANATAVEIDKAVKTFYDTYVDKFQTLYKDGKDLIQTFSDTESLITSLPGKITAFSNAVKNARKVAGEIGNADVGDEDIDDVDSVAVGALEEVLTQMEETLATTVEEIKESTINVVKDSIATVKQQMLESIGLGGKIDRINSIIKGDYFTWELSPEAKQDIVDFLQAVYSVYQTDSADDLEAFFKNKFLPDFSSFDLENLNDVIKSTLNEALEAIGTSAKDSIISLLTKLVNIVDGLFELNVFNDEKLNAYPNIVTDGNKGPQQDFLDAYQNLKKAIDEFGESFTSGNPIKMIIGCVTAIGKMFASIGKMIGAIIKIATDAVSNIISLGAAALSGDFGDLYERLLLGGYAVHNFPCRLDSTGELKSITSGNVTLKGSGLTGFAYDDIVRPDSYTGTSVDNNTDTMFKGAELEYIRSGTCSEKDNQTFVFWDIFFLRLILDIGSVLKNGDVRAISAMAGIASWVVLILYALAEPFCDTVIMVNGGTIPLLRIGENNFCWLTATGIPRFVHKLADLTLSDELWEDIQSVSGGNKNAAMIPYDEGKNGSKLNSIDYKTQLLIIILLYVSPSKILSRIQDLIQLEAAEYYRQQGKSFDINKAYTVLNLEAKIKYRMFFNLVDLDEVKIKQVMSY